MFKMWLQLQILNIFFLNILIIHFWITESIVKLDRINMKKGYNILCVCVLIIN